MQISAQMDTQFGDRDKQIGAHTPRESFYRECLQHYDTAPAPTRARRPKVKAKAEVGVQIAQRWILFRLRDRTFFSVEELNAELSRLTEMLNIHPLKKLQGCRRQRFEEGERASLKALPQGSSSFAIGATRCASAVITMSSTCGASTRCPPTWPENG